MNTRFALAAILLAALLALASRGQTQITFEPPYTPGPIAGQHGWLHSSFEPAGAFISDANPFSGAQHLRFGPSPDRAQQNLVSPLLLPPLPADSSTTFRFCIHQPDPPHASDFMLSALGPGGTTAWLVWFEAGGALRVSDALNDGGGIDTALAADPWTPDRYLTIRVDMQPHAGLIAYFLDDRPIHTGRLLQADSPARLEIIRPAPLPGWPDDDFMDLDDLSVIPEPGVIGLAAAGLIYLAWRRR